MKVFQGRSFSPNAAQAVAEATAEWDPEQALDLILVFCSTEQDPAGVAEAVAERYPNTLTVGCTTAGEHLSGSHSNKSLVITGVSSPEVKWAAAKIDTISSFEPDQAEQAAGTLFEALGADVDEVDPSRYFALLFIDGLRMKEEAVASALADVLEGVPLVGGSAGDDLKFAETSVFYNGESVTDAAVVVVASSDAPFSIVKHQHFTTSPKTLVVTRADPEQRRVYELDGYPALEAYAAALGMAPEAVNGDIAFLNPVTFTSNHEIYVRSVQSINDDASLTFYCAVEEGMVLDVGGHHDMVNMLADDLERIRGDLGKAELLIAFNCILRALEASGGNHHEGIGELLQQAAATSIGFDTYGEQLNGLHINQTLVALAIGKAA